VKPKTFEFDDFTVTVTHPQPPTSTWGRIKEVFLHPDVVEIEVVLHDGIELPEVTRRQVLADLRAEFGQSMVNVNTRSRNWALTVWLEPEVYDRTGIGYTTDVIGLAVDHARAAAGRA